MVDVDLTRVAKPRERRLMPRESWKRNRASTWIYRVVSHLDTRTVLRSGETSSAMNAFYDFVDPLLGLGAEPKDLTFVQISLRGVIVFLATLIMVRLGHKRSLARKTAFDAVLIVILASVLSRAINGSAAFFATLGGSVVIVLVHRLLAFIAYHSHWFGCLIKGRPEIIVENGDLILPVMHRNHISEHDLDEDLRLDAQIDDISRVRVARIERSGDISFIKKEESS
jgi:hypothetical protein